MSVYRTGRKILHRFPWLATSAAMIHNAVFFNRIHCHGKDNRIQKGKAYLRHCRINITGSDNTIILGEKVYLKDSFINIIGSHNVIEIAEKTTAFHGEFWLEDNNNQLHIGSHCTFAGSTHLAVTEGTAVTIGEQCLFSGGITFRTGDSHAIYALSNRQRINSAKSIQVGNHVWICEGATLLKGVSIADDSIVGTKALVTGQYEQSNCIIAGVPAKIVKSGINWTNERNHDFLAK